MGTDGSAVERPQGVVVGCRGRHEAVMARARKRRKRALKAQAR
jgi:hypothetical protein